MKLIRGMKYHYISKSGQVISMFKGKPQILKTAISRSGYEVIKLNGRTKRVHRMVAEAYITNYDNKPQVNHIDGNKLNNSVENLEWCTNSENQIHAYSIGLSKRRTPNNAAFKQSEAEDIVYLYSHYWMRIGDLAEDFNVSKTTIKDILKGKYYNIDAKRKPVTRPKSERKLTFEQAEEIRAIYRTSNISLNALGRQFGINHKTVQKNNKKYFLQKRNV